MVLYKVYVFRSSRIFNMAARANNMLWLAEISKIFFSETNELTLFGHNDVDTIVDSITNTILNIADNTIPNRFITVQKDSRPWITTSIKKFIRRKNRIHKKAKHTNFINHWEKYRITRNKCNNLIRMAKNDYFSTISDKIIAESSGSKNWWNLVTRLLGSSKNRSIPPYKQTMT
jgi:uncharacterized protein YeeX (DUF496 family)